MTNLEQLVKEIDKTFGKGTLVRLGDKIGQKLPSIPTGVFELDHEVIGSGGVPLGRITEFFGPPMGGKSSLALAAIGEAQAAGETCVYIDAEHTFDPTWASKCGVNVDDLLVNQPESGEVGLNIVCKLVESGQIRLIVVDSVAALTPEAELRGEIGERHVGLLARMMAQGLRKLARSIYTANCAVIFINQLRDNIGSTYSPTITPGGRSLPFAASLRLEVKKISVIKKDDGLIGNNVEIKAIKNKIGPPYKVAAAQLFYDSGFDKTGSIISYAIKKEIIKQAGSWYSYGDKKIGQGLESVKQWLQDEPDALHDIINKLI